MFYIFIKMIETGIKKLDDFLIGGIKKGTITDIFGARGTGKTQLAMQISINSLHYGDVFFQDTTGEFRPERLIEMIKARNMEPNLLERIKVGRVTNTAEQIQYLKKITHMNNFSLIIIDNVTDLFSFEYFKEKQLREKQILFMKYMHKLSLIAIQKKIPVIITNIMRNKDDLEIENLEKSISMYTHIKIGLSKHGSKYFGYVSSAFSRKKEFSYLITTKGLIDAS